MGTQLTLYYDGRCTFCATEMRRLAGWDRANRLDYVDICQPGFDPSHLNATMDDLNLEMVSQTADGKVLVGIDCLPDLLGYKAPPCNDGACAPGNPFLKDRNKQ